MTTKLLLVRHGPTAWNAERRLQGRAEIGLSAEAQARLCAHALPAEFALWRCLVSPLMRARDTAALLGLTGIVEPRLIEMDWGDYQGRALDGLRGELGPALDLNEARGLDFTPPRGESPRMVQTRLRPLLAEIAGIGLPTVAITHRGVIRAIYARAAGWDMRGPPPHALEPYAMQLFTLAADGHPSLAEANIALAPRR